MAYRLSAVSGEFLDPPREAAFQEERAPETARHASLLFGFSAILNSAFLVSDWRFRGTGHFYYAVPGRLAVVLVSLLCLVLIWRAVGFRAIQRAMILWQAVTALGIAMLVSSRSDLALFVCLLLPSIFYLAVPTAFRWTLIGGIGCSVAMLAGYLLPGPLPPTALGLGLVMVVLNTALALVVSRSNRLRRMEWAATASERAANTELAANRRTLESIFMAVPIPLVVTKKADGAVIRANDAARVYFGRDKDAASTEDVYIDPVSRQMLIDLLDHQQHAEGFETRMTLADGAARDVLLAASSLDTNDPPGIISGIVDITRRKQAEALVQHAALHDGLTGLPNRAHFHQHLGRLLASPRQDGERIGVLLVDIDAFKDINDTMGHDAGDTLLVQIAQRLRSGTPHTAFVARLGGDEFVITLGGLLAADDFQQIAERLLDSLRRNAMFIGREMVVRASIGIAIAPDHDSSPIELLKDADLALYTAKGQGRDRAVIYSPDMRLAMEQRVQLLENVEDALRHQRIIPFYQPSISLRTGAFAGIEALARWQHPGRGLQSPAAFLAAFDHPPLATEIGITMMRQVAADMRRWLDAGLEFGRVSVNFTSSEFGDPQLARRALAIFEAAGVPPSRLGVEVTETVFLGRDPRQVADILQQFHASGVQISLDDFGTGFASLTHLKKFPVDEIKIDQSFIQDIETDPSDATIVKAVIGLARSLRKMVTAEGVETQGQAEFLRANGCDNAQGFLFTKPVAADRMAALLHAPSWTYHPLTDARQRQEK
ncbi:MAG TPA: EAL domain-containing protein [Xanthobacteraceae bacterium]|nr:EAL domain-containing protein [Xanthobacteraceae bacterium]